MREAGTGSQRSGRGNAGHSVLVPLVPELHAGDECGSSAGQSPAQTVPSAIPPGLPLQSHWSRLINVCVPMCVEEKGAVKGDEGFLAFRVDGVQTINSKLEEVGLFPLMSVQRQASSAL